MKDRVAGLSLAILAILVFVENAKPGITHRIIHEIQQVSNK